jgi:hypothetical protein
MKNIKYTLDTIYKPLSRGNKIEIPNQFLDEYKMFSQIRYSNMGNSSRASNKRVFMKDNLHRIYPNEYKLIHSTLYKRYVEDEIGIKLIAREIGYSYTETRSILKTFNIPIRKGYDVITKNVSEFRRNKAKSEYSKRIGWFSSLDRKQHHTQRGVSGYYYNKSKNKYVWLRSTWEYIYAKFLDKLNIEWDIEVTRFDLDGSTYKPDFFIYNKGELEKIVEIKGYWKDKVWKPEELKCKIGVDVVVIYDISLYLEGNQTYYSQLEEWKTKRILEKNENKRN